MGTKSITAADALRAAHGLLRKLSGGGHLDGATTDIHPDEINSVCDIVTEAVATGDTELYVHARSARSWEVVERPVGDGPIPQDKIQVLYRGTSSERALIWAEGRSSATGQSVRVS